MSLIEKVFETEWFSIEAISNNLEDRKPYYRLSCNDSVAILAVTPEKKFVLVRQFRPVLGISMIELPSGNIDDNESPEEAIARELLEETGYVCKSLTCLGAYKNVQSRINNTLYLFLGQGAELNLKKFNNEEYDKNIEVLLNSEEKFKELIENKEYDEIGGIATYLIAKFKGYL